MADRFVEGTCPKCGYDDARGDQCDQCTNPLNPLELIKPRCVLCNTQPITRDTKHLSILLDQLQPRIEEWVAESSKKGKWSTNTVGMTQGWLREGLQPRMITRDLEWGVPVPLNGWEGKVMYVWVSVALIVWLSLASCLFCCSSDTLRRCQQFDAPIGYPSITKCYTDDWEQWWKDPENVTLKQFMGKDNVPFHTLFFPGYLLGTNDVWTMLDSISTTEYLNYEGTKFSKSRGVGVFGENAKDTGVAPDVWRYFLISNRPETSDSQFTWRAFIAANNAELLANLGNFVNRVIKFVNAKFDGVLPEHKGEEAELEGDKALKTDVSDLLVTYIATMEDMRIRGGLETLMKITARGNQYLSEAESKLDNTLLDRPERSGTVISLAVNLIYLVSVLVHPFMPSTEASILRQLNAPARSVPETFTGSDLKAGHKLGKAEYLFTRIDPKMEEVWKKQFGDKSSAGPEEPKKKKNNKKGAKLAETPAYTGPKTDELIAKEKEVAEQGEKVKGIKAGKQEGEVGPEVAKLLELKKELGDIVEKLRSVQVTTAQE